MASLSLQNVGDEADDFFVAGEIEELAHKRDAQTSSPPMVGKKKAELGVVEEASLASRPTPRISGFPVCDQGHLTVIINEAFAGHPRIQFFQMKVAPAHRALGE